MRSAVASRYAKALVDVVVRHPELNPADVLHGLRQVEDLIESSEDLKHALASPAVASSHKRAVMQRLMEPMGLEQKVQNFVRVVIDHRRADEFPEIIDAFEELMNEQLGIVSADIRSAQELTDSQKASLEAQVSRLAGKQAKLKYSLDPALIAGVVARVGSTVYDGSVRGQLERLRTRLSA